MKLELTQNTLTVTREPRDKKYYGIASGKGESLLLNDIKKELNRQGYDLIKKRMWKDGHLVDDLQQYLRTRKKGAGKADIYIYSGFWAVRGANEDFNAGQVVLNVERDVFN